MKEAQRRLEATVCNWSEQGKVSCRLLHLMFRTALSGPGAAREKAGARCWGSLLTLTPGMCRTAEVCIIPSCFCSWATWAANRLVVCLLVSSSASNWAAESPAFCLYSTGEGRGGEGRGRPRNFPDPSGQRDRAAACNSTPIIPNP